jgi:hypothetical protein
MVGRKKKEITEYMEASMERRQKTHLWGLVGEREARRQ